MQFYFNGKNSRVEVFLVSYSIFHEMISMVRSLKLVKNKSSNRRREKINEETKAAMDVGDSLLESIIKLYPGFFFCFLFFKYKP